LFKLLFQTLLGILFVAIALPAQAATLQEQPIVALIQKEVMARNNVAPQDVRVSWQDLDINTLVPFVPPGPVTLSIPPTAHLGGRANVPVEILINGQPFRTIFPRIEISIMRRVLVALNPIARGTAPGPDDIALKRLAMDGASDYYGAPLTSPRQIEGAEAIRDIPAGQVLSAQLFRIPPMVKMGETVNVTLQDGGLTLITSGLAQGTGARGTSIRVLNVTSHKEFEARITAPHEVSVIVEDQP
jgi:flagella basal body P-ring formation protein FlgA